MKNRYDLRWPKLEETAPVGRWKEKYRQEVEQRVEEEEKEEGDEGDESEESASQSSEGSEYLPGCAKLQSAKVPASVYYLTGMEAQTAPKSFGRYGSMTERTSLGRFGRIEGRFVSRHKNSSHSLGPWTSCRYMSASSS